MNKKSRLIATYGFFLAIAIIMVLLYWIFQKETWAPAFLALAAALIALVLVEVIWKLHGGDPITRAIAGVYKGIADLRTSTSLLRDLEGTGIERIHTKRRSIAFGDWYNLIASAHQVDIMGIVMRGEWSARREFIDIVQRRAGERKCKFRILVLDPKPDSPITKQRMAEEGDTEGRIVADGGFTLRKFNEIRDKLDNEAQKYVQTKVVSGSNLYCSVVRSDDRMLVINYLSHVRGGDSPSMEIHGRDTRFFQLFAAEFEKMWELGKEWPRSTPTEQIGAEG